MSKFADQLFEDLMAQHGAELASPPIPAAATAPRRTRRPVWAAAGTVTAAVTAFVGFTVFSGGAAAYAVTDNHDGTVTVAVKQASGIAGANGKLHSLGVPVVVVPGGGTGCTAIESIAVPPAEHTKITMEARTGPQGSVTVDVHGVPAGDKALVAFETFADGKVIGSMFLVRASTPVPSCVTLPTPPAGGATTTSGGGVQNRGEGPTDGGARLETAQG